MAGRKATSPAAASDVRAFHVLLEQVHSQMNVVLEAVTLTRTSLETQIKESEARLEARINILEQVVRQNSEDIRKNSEDIRELREEVRRLRHDFEHRAELTRIADLEGRVAALERRLGT